MAILAINGVDMPAPSTLSVRFEDSNGAVRYSIGGAAQVTRSGVKRRVDAYWAYLPVAQVQQLLTAAAMGSALFTLTYPDPVTGEARQMTAYSAERSVGLHQMNGAEPVWTGIRVVFMEG